MVGIPFCIRKALHTVLTYLINPTKPAPPLHCGICPSSEPSTTPQQMPFTSWIPIRMSTWATAPHGFRAVKSRARQPPRKRVLASEQSEKNERPGGAGGHLWGASRRKPAHRLPAACTMRKRIGRRVRHTVRAHDALSHSVVAIERLEQRLALPFPATYFSLFASDDSLMRSLLFPLSGKSRLKSVKINFSFVSQPPFSRVRDRHRDTHVSQVPEQ